MLGLQKPKKSAEQIFAEKVRYHKELDSRWAVLQVRGCLLLSWLLLHTPRRR